MQSSIVPSSTHINAELQPWPDWIWALWNEKIIMRFANGELCSWANYFTPRAAKNEWDKGRTTAGFVYVVQPGNHVCEVSWEAT